MTAFLPDEMHSSMPCLAEIGCRLKLQEGAVTVSTRTLTKIHEPRRPQIACTLPLRGELCSPLTGRRAGSGTVTEKWVRVVRLYVVRGREWWLTRLLSEQTVWVIWN
jgi:hypothetical protein